MIDITGRQVNDYDMVVCSYSHQGTDLRFGIWYNNAAYGTYNCNCDYRSPVKLVYKVFPHDPEEKELYAELKENLDKYINAKKLDEERKKNLKRIPAKELEVGSSYVTNNGNIMTYLGYGRVTGYVYDAYRKKIICTSYSDGFICTSCDNSTQEKFDSDLIGRQIYSFKIYSKRPFFVRKLHGPVKVKSEFSTRDETKKSTNSFVKVQLDMRN